MAKEWRVTPYDVEGNVDYDIFAKDFGISLIDKKLEDRIRKIAGGTHHLLRRRIFYAHRDLGLAA